MGSDQYTSSDYRELLIRWFQLAAFVPITRYHGQGGELWLYGEEVTRSVTQTLRFRYRMLPYIYSLVRGVEQRGGTLQRHFSFDFLADPVAATTDDAFMFGPALLVAPVVRPSVRRRSLYLPRLP